jgi:hypothetical protein
MTRAAALALPLMILAAGGAEAAPPAPAALEEAFGNTIVSTYPDGRTARLWLQPSGEYTGAGRRGDRSSGHWRVKGYKLCLKQKAPVSVPFSFCTPIPSAEEWSAKAVSGEKIRVRLVKGAAPRGPVVSAQASQPN